MANAYRDENFVPTLIAASSSDGFTPTRLYADPTTHRLLVDLPPAASGITSINSDTTAAQTLTVGTTGTDFAIVDNGTGDHKFNLPTASGTNRGALSSADWTTFNNKQAAGSYLTAVTADSPLSGSGTSGSHLVLSTSGTWSGNAATATNAAGLSATLVPASGGTGVSNNNSATVTSSGNFAYTRTLTGTTNVTFPTSGTLAISSAAQTFTGTQTFANTVLTANAITASGNAATVPVTSGRNIVTNNSAATLTITMTTTSAVNMQTCIVQILDASAVAQTISWVNTENSTVSAPTTSNGSITLPLTVGFIYNAATSKWRAIASA